MRVHTIAEKTYAEGPGCRFCIWIQGCGHKCDGCFAKELWSFDGGFYATPSEIISMIKSVEKEICGITLLGGEPFEYADELAEVAKYIQSIGKSVIIFTGYRYEQLADKPWAASLLEQTDLLIDGRFEKELKTVSLPLIGSSNQRFIFLTDKISKEEIYGYKNRFEVRISDSGSVSFNGMGNIEKLQEYINTYKQRKRRKNNEKL